jgi:hypothetical protein
MQYRIRFSDQDFLFEETPTQQLVPATSEPSGPGIEQHFSFDETGSKATLVLYGPSESSPVRSHHYRFLVQTIRILNDYRAGAVFLAGVKMNHGFPRDVGYRSLPGSAISSPTTNGFMCGWRGRCEAKRVASRNYK